MISEMIRGDTCVAVQTKPERCIFEVVSGDNVCGFSKPKPNTLAVVTVLSGGDVQGFRDETTA
jgi:hypothetical protein